MAALTTSEGEKWRAEQACAWLTGIRSLIGYEDALTLRAKAELARADNLRSLDFTRPAVKGSRKVDAIPEAVAAHVDASELIAGIAKECSRKVADAAERLSRMDDPTDAEVLSRYYLDPRARWSDVAKATHFSYDGLMKRRRDALALAYYVMPHYLRDRVEVARPREFD